MTTFDLRAIRNATMRKFIALLVMTVCLGAWFAERLASDYRAESRLILAAMVAAVSVAVTATLLRRRRSRTPSDGE